MAMILKTVSPERGAHWVRDGWQLYRRKPLAFTGMFLLFMLLVQITSVVPLLGPVIMFALWPLMSLGLMVAAQSALLGGRVGIGQFFEPLRGHAARARGVLLLCLLFAAVTLATLWLANAIADNGIARLAALARPGQVVKASEIEALFASRSVTAGLLFMTVTISLTAVPFWHALALVHWGGQGVWQSLFSSTLALWRGRGAYFVYMLTWFGVTVALWIVTSLLVALFGVVGSFAGAAGMLVVSTLFYVSLIFTFNDSFGSMG